MYRTYPQEDQVSYHPPESIVSILTTIRSTNRPRLLLRAARIGTQDYNRETDLRRVLRLPATPPPGAATVRALIELEARLESARKRPFQPVGEDALESWRPARHVEVMIALIAEARLMAEAVQPR